VLNANQILFTATKQRRKRAVRRECGFPSLGLLEAPQVKLAIVPGPSVKKPAALPFSRSRSFRPAQARDKNMENLLPFVLPLLQATIWEAWGDTLELIAMDSGRCEPSALFLDPSLQQPGTRWLDRICPLDLRQTEAFLTSDQSATAQSSIDYRVILTSGELLWVRHWLLHRSTESSGRIRLTGLIMAIPEQKRLEWECLRVSERERNRLGHELHDDVCQVLAGLSYMMRVLAGRLMKEAPALHLEFNELNADVVAAMERTRSMAHGLFPAQLNYTVLRQALQEFARQVKTRFGLAIVLDLPRRLPHHTPEQIIHIYRIAQEAVSNSIRHGKATAVRIAVKVSAENMDLRVEDNGTGFPASASRPEGIGMHVMQYRARFLGGCLNFGNHPPAGAFVQLQYPLAETRLS
jgi:signal transduction histidine kinase